MLLLECFTSAVQTASGQKKLLNLQTFLSLPFRGYSLSITLKFSDDEPAASYKLVVILMIILHQIDRIMSPLLGATLPPAGLRVPVTATALAIHCELYFGCSGRGVASLPHVCSKPSVSNLLFSFCFFRVTLQTIDQSTSQKMLVSGRQLVLLSIILLIIL